MQNHKEEAHRAHRYFFLVGVVAILLGVLSISAALQNQKQTHDSRASEISGNERVAGTETMAGMDMSDVAADESPMPTDPVSPSPVGPSPTQAPSPTPVVIGDKADATDTDNYVNRFLKSLLAAGDHSWGAAGSWWGDTKHANEDQLWVVVKDVKPGQVVPAGQPITKTYTCLQPGKIAGKGTGPNRYKLPKLRFQIGGRDPYPTGVITTLDQLEKFQTMSNSNLPANGSIELRTDCIAKADPALVDPILAKDELRVNFDTEVWVGEKATGVNSTGKIVNSQGLVIPNEGNHVGLATDDNKNGKFDPIEKIRPLIDSHGWYTGVDYLYTVMNDPAALMGKKVTGTLKVTGWAFKNSNSSSVPVHHHGVKIEQDDEDYWMDSQYVSPPTGSALTTDLIQRSPVTFSIDTSKLKNGWHILSYHSHAIEHRTTVPTVRQFKQIADELKIPICVDNPQNPNAGQCENL